MQNLDLLLKQLEVTRGSNTIIRNHTTVTNSPPNAYNIGNHLGGGLQLLLLFFPDASIELIRHWAFHDYLEYETGDIVGAAKVKYPKLGTVLDEIETDLEKNEYKVLEGFDLIPLEKIVLDYIDRGELLLWCFEQYHMGCRTKRFLKMMNRVGEKVKKLRETFNSTISKQRSEYDEHLHKGVNTMYTVIDHLSKEIV
ncbi:hypothetical protein EVB81_134 [Rhizobium phage RHph_I46]|uniref:Uncharacterized protein n=1 Tax=Rhizobium phage RHph_I1_9 TaxID=2509729 RepID=A0A7S5REW1_9CAUD|nr:hypothetical protein PP936_gp133 [Rhizobium phage RHph_I1_9]QIG69703.1 hypothetical protein EVB81_134 [Rhizobium phage RHph_I46]QIG70984.1 hypothetical protein EVB92_134 [Rhizobium phage RHph_I9]QIG73570.1 hypothetical protein EVC04_133 [Rhizobium phage RHph_I1_9]QIG76323.1 hypothetical protein EVC25_134 [Rhizobium phage RHph_I34]